VDPITYRSTLSSHSTGVVIVSALGPDGPLGLAVGSFSSVSLDPPLVGFFPDKSSTSWPKIADTGSFCVNVLAADQLAVCEAFAKKGGDKYSSVAWRPAPDGSPILDGVLAWIDCQIDSITEVGDHWFVTGRTTGMGVEREGVGPLIFFRRSYGTFSESATP